MILLVHPTGQHIYPARVGVVRTHKEGPYVSSHAGVVRKNVTYHLTHKGLSRTCGGGSGSFKLKMPCVSSIPRMRGWFESTASIVK